MRAVAWLAVLVVLFGAAWLMFARAPALPPPVPANAPGLKPAAPPAMAPSTAPVAPVATPAPAPAPAPPADLPKEPPLRVRTNVPGATVHLSILPKGASMMTDLPDGTAGPDGTAEFVLPRPRAEIDQVEAVARAPGWFGMRHESAGEDITLVLERGFEISGRVVFPDGRPVPGVGVYAGKRHAATDDEGRFAVGPFDAGPVEVHLFDGEGSRTVEAGTVGLDLTMKRHLLRIRVVDEAGAPVPSGTHSLKVFDGEVRSLWAVGSWSDGDPIRGGAPAGAKAVLQCSADGYEGQTVEWTLGDPIGIQDRTVVLSRPGAPGTLVLRVNSGPEPLPAKVRVTLQDASGHWIEGFLDLGVPLVDGIARIEKAPSATRRIRVQTSSRVDLRDFGLPREAEVRVEPGRETTLEIALAFGGRITVVVKDARGTVLPARTRSHGIELLDERGEKVDIDFGNETEDGTRMRFPPRNAA
ncbi:MAG TPA: carboxypeptidase-like regulatory domain-containing protein, partial [Planctomycetota bacterium]|nr:carboxypeptidase-like regulatory domain-containing protein [Planctomycetota bacterium]